MIMIGIGILPGGLSAIIGSPVFALLIGTVYFWKKMCRPKLCQLLRALLAGLGLGAIILAILAVFEKSTPQLITTLLVGICIAALTVILSWKKGCYRR